MRRCLMMLLLPWLVTGLPSVDQGVAANQAAVTGIVVDGVSGNPLVGATVTLHDPKGMPRTIVVDERRARFTFAQLRPGMYSLRALRSGFSGGGYAQRTPQGPVSTLELAPEEQVDVRLVLWPNPTVRGKVVDDFGDPVAKVSVRAFIQTFVGGHPKLLPHLSATTNDLGEYYLSLAPRTYVIGIPSAGLPAQSRRREVLDPLVGAGYPTTFYSASSTTATATAIELEAGENRSGIDFALIKSRMFRVTGVVIGFESRKGPVEVKLVPSAADSDTRELETARSVTAADGSFEFAMVPPGAYRIRAGAYPVQRAVDGTLAAFQSGDGSAFVGLKPGSTAAIAPTPTGSTLWADVPIRVGEQDLLGVSVRLEQGAHIEGQLAFRGSVDRPSDDKLAAAPLFVLAADGRDLGRFPVTRIQPGGRFLTIGLPPGKYILSAPLGLDPWRIAGVAVRGREQDLPIVLGSVDISDLQLTLTDRTTTLSGATRDENGKPQPHAPIYIFPKDKTLWTDFGPWPSRIRQVQASRAARWQVTGLPAGDYYVASTWASIPQAWMQEAVFDRLARLASPISIAYTESRTLDLTVRARW